MLELIKQDIKRYNYNDNFFNILKLYFTNRGFKAVVIYRLSNYFYKKRFKILAMFFQQRNIKLNSCEIGFETNIEEGFKIRHPVGIVISGNSYISSNVTIAQNVTIGEKYGKYPIIKKNCDIGAGSIILGEVEIGENSNIGANAFVGKNVDKNSTVIGVPFRYLK